MGCIIETPRTPKQISEVIGIEEVHARVVLRRLAKDGKVIRDRHTYLCAPHAVPSYLRNIPDDADEFTADEMEAQYDAWVAGGGLDAIDEPTEAAEETIIGIDEPIEAPDMVSKPPVALHEVIMPDWSGYPAAIVHVMAPSEPYAVVRARNEALDVQSKLEGRQRLAEDRRKHPNRPSMAQMKRNAKARRVMARRTQDEADKRQWLVEHGTMALA